MRLEEERCWLEIDLEKLRRNAAIVEGLAGPGCTPIGVVKTNCYGLGGLRVPDIVHCRHGGGTGAAPGRHP